MRINVLDHGYVELVDSMPASPGAGDKAIVNAARVSIEGEQVRPVSDDAKLLKYLMTNKHTTPFEVVRFTFRVQLPIFVERQWVRHRMATTNEMSARYGVLPDTFYIPDPSRLTKQSTDNKQGSSNEQVEFADDLANEMRIHCAQCYEMYEGLLAEGLSRELARMVLPINIYTRKMWTVDMHNLMHFLRLRLDSHAQYEIRVYAEAIRELITPIAPMTMELFESTRPRREG